MKDSQTPDITPLDELLEVFVNMEADYRYAASKNIKDPKVKRQRKIAHRWAASMLHYLKELNELKNK